MKKMVLSAVIPLLFVVGADSALAAARVGNHSTPYAGLALQQGLGDFGSGFKVYGGYEFMDFDMGKHLVYVSGEVAYHDFGKKSGVSASGLSFLANAHMKVAKDLDVYAHGGLAQTTVKVKKTVCAFGICTTASGSATQTGLTIGGGVHYNVTDKFNVLAGVDMYNTDSGNQNELSLGAEVRF